MSTVHPSAFAFDKVADEYEAGRPGYPKAAVDYVFAESGLSRRSAVLEVGAGSGKLSRLLIDRVKTLTLVEPIPAMRQVLAAALPDAAVVDGTAEAVPLEEGTVDAVLAAQAFHWFRAADALRESHRVLRRKGSLALLWNIRDEAVAVNRRISAIIEPLKGDTPRYASVDWPRILTNDGLFTMSGITEVPHSQRLDESDFANRFMSVSWIASLPDLIRRSVHRDLIGIFTEHASDGTVTVPYRTRVFLATKR